MEIDVLAIGAHPDDVELTCGGTLYKCKRQGRTIGIVDLTEGEMGTRGTRRIRSKEAQEAARILGCRRENLRLPDGRIEVNSANTVRLMRVLRKYRPKILLIPPSDERHPDHIHAHILCREAWFYSGLRKIETKLNGRRQEPWRPDRYYQYMQWFEFTPSFIVDITDVYDVRLRSILAYKSQLYDPGSKDPQTLLSQRSFLDLIETRAKYYGYRIGARYGEPFNSADPVGIDDLFGLKMFKG